MLTNGVKMVFFLFILVLLFPFVSKADGLFLKVESGLSSISAYENLFKDYPVYLFEKSVYPSFSVSVSRDFKFYYFEGGAEVLGVSSNLYFYSGEIKEYQLAGGYLFAGGGFKKDLRDSVLKGGIDVFLKFYENFSVDGSDFSTDFLSDFFPVIVFSVDTFFTEKVFLSAVFKSSIGDVLTTPIAKGGWSSFSVGVGFRL